MITQVLFKNILSLLCAEAQTLLHVLSQSQSYKVDLILVICGHLSMWINRCQVKQNSELFPVHVMDFLERINVKTSIKFMGPCNILQLYSKYFFIFEVWLFRHFQSCDSYSSVTCKFPESNEKQAQRVSHRDRKP